MAYIFGQHLYSERRYSWIDEWSAQLPPQDLWFKSGCLPGAWDAQICEPGVWQPVICGPVPPIDRPPLTAIQGQIRGEIRPIGSLHAKVDPPDAIAGRITGSVAPVGSLHGTITLPPVQGTITGVLRPVGSIHASQASDWVGILPQFGPAHHTSMTVSTFIKPNDRIKVDFGQGTGHSLDRLPGGKVVWKIHVVQASGVDSRLGAAKELAPGDPNLVWPPGFAEDGVTLNQDGGIYDGFPRPGTGVTFGTGSYILQGRDSAQGNWWVGTTDATGTNVVWHGDPVAGTGEAWKFPDPTAHAAVFGSSGDIFEFVPTVASEIPGRAPLGIHGVVHPVGSLHGLVAVPAITGTITGVVRPGGSLHGKVSVPLTTWNPSDKNAGVTLSSSNSVATNTAFSWHAVRAVAGKSSGKWAFRVTPTIGGTPEVNIGIGTSSAALSGGAIGTDNNAYGYAGSNGGIYKNGVILVTYQAYASGQPVDVCADLDNNRLWVRRAGGNWNNSGTANPATNVGGLDISALAGTKYPIWNGYNVNDSATLAVFAPLPSGFSDWG